MIRPPGVELLGYASAGGKQVVLDLAQIQKVTPLDVTFVPRPDDPLSE